MIARGVFTSVSDLPGTSRLVQLTLNLSSGSTPIPLVTSVMLSLRQATSFRVADDRLGTARFAVSVQCVLHGERHAVMLEKWSCSAREGLATPSVMQQAIPADAGAPPHPGGMRREAWVAVNGHRDVREPRRYAHSGSLHRRHQRTLRPAILATSMSMSARLIFFNIGWMKRYQGISEDDRPEGGGKWVEENAWDYSMLNFKRFNGHCYGYGETGSQQVNLSRLGAVPEQDRLDGVIVVSVSRSPEHGPVIAGWYKKATLFREYQEPPEGSGREHDGTPIGFYATAAADDCILLPDESRTFPVPRGKGGMGQSNVWYADQPEHQPFKERVLEYINSNGTYVQEGLPKAWIFQANPRFYDIDAAMRALSQMTWTVSAYKNQIAPGDEVFLWRSGPEAGIIAIATVLAGPALMGDEEESFQFAHDQERFSGEQLRVRLRLDQVVSPALSKEGLKADARLSQLSILKFSQGTNFMVTPGEAKAIHELLEKGPTVSRPSSSR